LVKLRDRKFESALRPYLVEAYRETPGTPGIAGRLKQSIGARQMAIRAMETDLRITVDEEAGQVNLVRFLLEYSQRGVFPPI
jgi:preprotein translocase subunit SecB